MISDIFVTTSLVKYVYVSKSKEDKSGPKKKEYVMRCAKKWLSDNGLDLPDESLNALIESLVYDLNSAKEVILHD